MIVFLRDEKGKAYRGERKLDTYILLKEDLKTNQQKEYSAPGDKVPSDMSVYDDLNETGLKDKEIEDAKTAFAVEVKKGFQYKDHTFQCDEVDQDRWTKGVSLMERHGFESANAVDINNDEWEMTLAEMIEIKNLAEDTWFTLWFDYQGVKNGTA